MKHDLVKAAIGEAQARRSLPEPALRRLVRERAGLTQQDVALAIGVSRPTVSRYEAGQRTPRRDHLHDYLTLLDRLAQAGTDHA
jgi:HTH-type transcriptional regulator/antitoxin MqsA